MTSVARPRDIAAILGYFIRVADAATVNVVILAPTSGDAETGQLENLVLELTPEPDWNLSAVQAHLEAAIGSDPVAGDTVGPRLLLTGQAITTFGQQSGERPPDLTISVLAEASRSPRVIGAGGDLAFMDVQRETARLAAFVAEWKRDPMIGLRDVPLLLKDELRTAATYQPPPTTPLDVIKLIVAAARRNPDNRAVEAGEYAVTYRELLKRADELAMALQAMGTAAGTRVAVHVTRGLPTVVALLAILRIGAVYVPIPPAYPTRRKAFLVRDAEVAVCVQDLVAAVVSNKPEPINELNLRTVWLRPDGGVASLDTPRQPSHRNRSRPARAGERGDTAAYVMYTSGSTGQPKGVLVGRRSLSNVVQDTTRLFEITDRDRVGATTTTSFDISLLELLDPLTAGACCVVAPTEISEDPSRWGEWVSENAISVVQATPSAWRTSLEHFPARLRLAISGGEALAEDLAASLREHAGRVVNCYGPTETTIWSSAWFANGGTVCAGIALAGNTLTVLDRWCEPRPPTFPGDLWIYGESLAFGYLNRPDEQLAAFRELQLFGDGERCYRTGDRATLTTEGVLLVHGRRDGQVKIRGHRVESGEVESAIRSLDFVSDAAVIVYQTSTGDQALAAYVTPADVDAPPTESTIRTILGETLPAYLVPTAVTVLERLPVSAAGKVDRSRLRELACVVGPKKVGLSASNRLDPLEWLVRTGMSELLGRAIGPDESFFDEGGDSLLAVRLLARLRRLLGCTVRTLDLHRAPTARSLTRRIRAAEPAITMSVAALGWPSQEFVPVPAGWVGAFQTADDETGDVSLVLVRPAIETAAALSVAAAAPRGAFVLTQDRAEPRTWTVHHPIRTDSGSPATRGERGRTVQILPSSAESGAQMDIVLLVRGLIAADPT